MVYTTHEDGDFGDGLWLGLPHYATYTSFKKTLAYLPVLYNQHTHTHTLWASHPHGISIIFHSQDAMIFLGEIAWFNDT
jgi:hypothetical protein